MNLPNQLSLSLTIVISSSARLLARFQTVGSSYQTSFSLPDFTFTPAFHRATACSYTHTHTHTHIEFLYFIVKINMWPGAKDTVSVQHVKTLYVKLPMEYLEYLYISAWSVWEFQWFVDPNPINIDFNISFIFHHLSHQYLMTASLCPLLQIEVFYRNYSEHMKSLIV